MRNLLFITALLIGSLACQLPEIPTAPRINFSPDVHLYEWALSDGSGEIAGEAFLRQRGGGVVTCAGAGVVAYPAGPWVDAWVKANDPYWRSNMFEEELHPDLFGYTRHTTCRNDGTFVFRNMPAGDWFITTTVTWWIPGRYGGTEGGVLTRRVSVANDLVEIIIN